MKMEGISLQRRRGNLLEVISGWTGSKSCVHIYKFMVEIALARGGVKGSILDFAALDALEVQHTTCNLLLGCPYSV